MYGNSVSLNLPRTLILEALQSKELLHQIKENSPSFPLKAIVKMHLVNVSLLTLTFDGIFFSQVVDEDEIISISAEHLIPNKPPL